MANDDETGRLLQLARELPDAHGALMQAQLRLDERYRALAKLRSRFPHWEQLNQRRNDLRELVETSHPHRQQELDAIELELHEAMSNCLNSLAN